VSGGEKCGVVSGDEKRGVGEEIEWKEWWRKEWIGGEKIEEKSGVKKGVSEEMNGVRRSD
jgi:hypothetical protein